MTLGKSLRLSACNWKVLVKSVICQVLIYALVAALCATAFGGIIAEVTKAIEKSGIVDFVKQTIAHIADGTFDPNTFSDGVKDIVSSLQSAIGDIKGLFGSMEATYAVLFLVVLAYRMLIAVTDVTTGFQLEEFMTSNATRPFSWFFFKKQRQTWEFCALQMVFTLPLDMTIVFGCLGFYLLFLVTFRWWTIIPIAIVGVLLYTARLTLFAFCLPAVVTEGVSVREAFRTGLSTVFRRFGQVYAKTLLVVVVMLAFLTCSIVFIPDAYGLSFLGVLPGFVLFFVLKNIDMCEYFEATNRPYFSKVMDVEGTERYIRKHGKPVTED